MRIHRLKHVLANISHHIFRLLATGKPGFPGDFGDIVCNQRRYLANSRQGRVNPPEHKVRIGYLVGQ